MGNSAALHSRNAILPGCKKHASSQTDMDCLVDRINTNIFHSHSPYSKHIHWNLDTGAVHTYFEDYNSLPEKKWSRAKNTGCFPKGTIPSIQY